MRDVFAAVLGLVIVIAFIALIGGLMFHPISMEATQTQLLNTFLGMLATMAAGVVAFYFGSSSSDKSKNDTISTLANTASTTAATASTSANTAAVLAGTGNGNGNGVKPGVVDVVGTVKVTEPK